MSHRKMGYKVHGHLDRGPCCLSDFLLGIVLCWVGVSQIDLRMNHMSTNTFPMPRNRKALPEDHICLERHRLGMMVHAYNVHILEAEAGG